MTQLTAIIKTFERPDSVKLLVKSIRQFYPTLPIIIADDSRQPVELRSAEVHPLPFDVGLSAGRNYLLRQVKTPYFLLCDDDFEFTRDTKIPLLLTRIRKGFDIVSGRVNGQDYHGTLEVVGETLHYRSKSRGRKYGFPTYDMTWNFFIGKTEKVKAIGWDERLKLAEHTDFFLRAKGLLTISHCTQVNVAHHYIRTPDYNTYRQRALFYSIRMMKKHGLTRTIGFDGKENTIKRYTKQFQKVKDSLAAL